jgi:hypothetical protein
VRLDAVRDEISVGKGVHGVLVPDGFTWWRAAASAIAELRRAARFLILCANVTC